MSETIRVRVVPTRQGPSLQADARSTFWASLRETQDFSNESIEQYEARLVYRLGPSLRNRLIESVQDEIREFEKGLFGVDGGVWQFLDHELHFMRREKGWPYAWADPVVKYFELRQQAFAEVPQFRTNIDKLAAAVSIHFSTQIRGYSSLDLELLIGSAEKLGEVFDENFDAFRVFLDCFIPIAFADVFNAQFAEQMRYDISAPTELQNTFKKKPSLPNKPVTAGSPPSTFFPHDTVKKAEWIWRLANGSLLVPLLLALIVLYFGLREISSLRTAQYDALKPILEHQVQLLREDRERMAADHAAVMATKREPMPNAERTASSADQSSGKGSQEPRSVSPSSNDGGR